jgi:phage gp46-like protein
MRWWADTDGTHGSQLYTLRTLTRGTPSLAEAFANEAVQPLINARRIINFAPHARSNVNGQRFVLDFTWSVPGNKPRTNRIAI